MAEAPTGTITFLFTDVEGSTRLWQEHPESMRAALAQHDRLLREAIDGHNGYIFSTGGDSFAAAFTDPLDAVNAALSAQGALSEADWGELGGINVRMAVDTGLAEHRDGDYFGPPLNRAARIEELARGGNILLSNTTADLVRYNLPPSFLLEPFGEHKLRDVERKVTLFRLQPEVAHVRSRAVLFGGLAASGAVLAVIAISAVVLATRSPSLGQPATSVVDDSEQATQSTTAHVWSVAIAGPVSRPLILAGAVHVVSSADDNATLLAFDGMTGEERWRFEADGPLRGMLHTDGRAVYMVTTPQIPPAYRSARGLDWLWVIDPAGGSRIPGCGSVLHSTNTRLAVSREAVFALVQAGGLYKIPTKSDGPGRCHDMAEHVVVVNAAPISSGPVVAGSKVFISDSRSIYQLAATDLELEDDYLPALGRIEGYRGTPAAIDSAAVRIQGASSIIETVPVFAVDGEGLLHGSPDGLAAMTPTAKTVTWPPLVADSGVILLEAAGSLASYSHDLSTMQWDVEVGAIRSIELGGSVMYVTDDAGVVVLDLESGEEIWRLETASATSSTGAGGWIYVQTEDDELKAYVLDDTATQAAPPTLPIVRQDAVDPIDAVESFYTAFNDDKQAALTALLGVDARIDGLSVLDRAGQETLDWWQQFSSPLGYRVEISNCSVTQEYQMAVLVSCDAVAHDGADDLLGIAADGTTEVWVADGLIRGFVAQRSNRISAATVYGGDDFAWLLWIGFSYIPTDNYRETLDAVELWALDRYGADYDSVCDVLFKGDLGQWPDCTTLREQIAAEYVAEVGS